MAEESQDIDEIVRSGNVEKIKAMIKIRDLEILDLKDEVKNQQNLIAYLQESLDHYIGDNAFYLTEEERG